MLDNTLLIVTTDHGHCIGDNNYIGKRPYPSSRAENDVPVIIRHPDGIGAGKRSDLLINHNDISALILEFAGVRPPTPIDGISFWQQALDGGPAIRDHVTTAWGSAVTVVDDRWWLNIKIDGTGGFLYDLKTDPKLTKNVADDYPDEVKRLYRLAVQDAEGGFPEFLQDLCARQVDAPGCSSLVARE
jgi:arylsulfatase A-like enzyme